MRLSATTAVAAGNMLGEGILWSRRDQSVYWTDITAATLWRHCPSRSETQTWTMPEQLASFALCADNDWLLLGLASRLAFLHLPSGKVIPICDIEPGMPTRVNDGACDREGRFVFGTKHEVAEGRTPSPVGSFYRLDADLSLHRLPLGRVAIANGIAFSPEGRIMYFCDSPTRVIKRCEYSTQGAVREVREWIDLRGIAGEPDGSTVDAEGGLWNAQWDMGRVVRYDPQGRADTCVEVPVRRPTRPALGGIDMNTLFVTSAGNDAALAPSVNGCEDGHVFTTTVAQHGLPESCFAGAPPGIRVSQPAVSPMAQRHGPDDVTP